MIRADPVMRLFARHSGLAAIEGIVDGRYEWRDAGFKRPRHAGR